MTDGEDTEGRRRRRLYDLAPAGEELDGDERHRVEERLGVLVALGAATRGDDDALTIMATSTRMVAQHLGVTRCAYGDVEADGNHFTIRQDWHVSGAESLVGAFVLDDFGEHTAITLRAGKTLVIGNVDEELGSLKGADAFHATDIQAVICSPLVKSGRLVALMAVHHRAPRAWTAGDIALVEEVVERCWAHIERARCSIELLAGSRRKDDFIATQRALIDTRAVIDAAVETSRPFIEATGHQLMITMPVVPLPIDGDVIRLAQVVTNLLHNAAKYTLYRGRIDLVVEREPDFIVLHVKDAGAGISARDLPFLFDAFAPPLTRMKDGLGIGLSLVRKLVEMHGGTVTAASAGVGHGSTFTVRLPASTAREPTAAPPESSVRVGTLGTITPPTGRRVLVVDDNVDAAEMLAMMLRLEGHRASVVHDGPAAIASLRETPFEVVFLDIGMPAMDGFDVARQLRAEPAFAALKIVALTGWASADDKRRAMEAGFDVHLTKPINAEAVQALLAQLLG